MFERHQGGDKAVLIHIDFADTHAAEDLQELRLLTSSAGAEVVGEVTGRRYAPHAKYYCGLGKAEEIAAAVQAHEADLVIFNHSLSPSQERNLEKLCQCRVLDRTGLILDIFAQRARTHEGKLQVELAQLKHLSTRLVRGWTHLERQKGGIGLRGPGETQLETDRRLLGNRIVTIQKRLQKVAKQREQGRRARKKAEIPTVSLVGYTNAGKSSLFNAITVADVYAADQLFATLDPTLRRLQLAEVGPVVLADTVGFVRHLPHDLVAAFKATLQETQEADLLLHVVDYANPQKDENIDSVNEVLAEIDAQDIPQLIICNKIDLLSDRSAKIDYDETGKPIRVWLSANEKQGLDLLEQALTQLLGREMLNTQLKIPPADGKLKALLYEYQCITHERYDELGNWLVDIHIQQADFARLDKRCDGLLSQYQNPA